MNSAIDQTWTESESRAYRLASTQSTHLIRDQIWDGTPQRVLSQIQNWLYELGNELP